MVRATDQSKLAASFFASPFVKRWAASWSIVYENDTDLTPLAQVTRGEDEAAQQKLRAASSSFVTTPRKRYDDRQWRAPERMTVGFDEEKQRCRSLCAAFCRP